MSVLRQTKEITAASKTEPLFIGDGVEMITERAHERETEMPHVGVTFTQAKSEHGKSFLRKP